MTRSNGSIPDGDVIAGVAAVQCSLLVVVVVIDSGVRDTVVLQSLDGVVRRAAGQ